MKVLGAALLGLLAAAAGDEVPTSVGRGLVPRQTAVLLRHLVSESTATAALAHRLTEEAVANRAEGPVAVHVGG
ncbi:MAG: hypothetical protein ACYC8T_38355, partial [Myxococcaceae bacterium]